MKQSERQARGMMDADDEDYSADHHPPMKDQSKATAVDPWANYYDFIINEGSFKFWAVFQLGTALLLIYSAFAAVYYAKFNVSSTDYDYYYDFFARSNSGRSDTTSWLGISPQTFQRIIDAISSKKYS
ncbi:uncharacterized protein LOC112906596 [Agrilus planipennis]|nr:uncharacterized protein LOC112906596 [Agrilus planipennis]